MTVALFQQSAMDFESLLTIDGQPLSWRNILDYLQVSGDLDPFINKILRQYVLSQELRSRPDLEIASELVEQAVIDFRLEHKLSDREQYQKWLTSYGMDNATFHQKCTLELKLKKLVIQVTEPNLDNYFIQRKPFLDLIVISRIVVAKEDFAAQLRDQIEQGASFEKLAQEHSLADETILNGMMGPIKMGTLPDALKQVIDVDRPGQLIGPLAIEDQWALFRVEQFLPASLYNEGLKEELRLQLFEQWIAEKIQKLTVQVWGGE